MTGGRRGADVAVPVGVPDRATRLWIGSAEADIPASVRTVVTVAAEAAPLTGGVVEHRHPFSDTRWTPVPRDIVEEAVARARLALKDGDVLVRCHRGANRSALVVALVLRHQGVAGAVAVAAIRDARGPLALSNPYFEHLVRTWPRDPMTHGR